MGVDLDAKRDVVAEMLPLARRVRHSEPYPQVSAGSRPVIIMPKIAAKHALAHAASHTRSWIMRSNSSTGRVLVSLYGPASGRQIESASAPATSE